MDGKQLAGTTIVCMDDASEVGANDLRRHWPKTAWQSRIVHVPPTSQRATHRGSF